LRVSPHVALVTHHTRQDYELLEDNTGIRRQRPRQQHRRIKKARDAGTAAAASQDAARALQEELFGLEDEQAGLEDEDEEAAPGKAAAAAPRPGGGARGGGGRDDDLDDGEDQVGPSPVRLPKPPDRRRWRPAWLSLRVRRLGCAPHVWSFGGCDLGRCHAPNPTPSHPPPQPPPPIRQTRFRAQFDDEDDWLVHEDEEEGGAAAGQRRRRRRRAAADALPGVDADALAVRSSSAAAALLDRPVPLPAAWRRCFCRNVPAPLRPSPALAAAPPVAAAHLGCPPAACAARGLVPAGGGRHLWQRRRPAGHV
jgi:hypothetical protein